MKDEDSQQYRRILVVEDDDAARAVVHVQLKKYYQIDLAVNGEEAIELFLHNEYQLILTDINLGIGKNGIEVMKEIRKTAKGKITPVIAITAYSNFGDKDSFLDAGFDNYISKPYHSDDLLRIVLDSINIYNN